MIRIATLSVLALALSARAQETKQPATQPGAQSGTPPAMPAPKPDPALAEAFQDAVGNWRCSGQMSMPPDMGGGQVQTRSRMSIRPESGGFAYAGEFRMEKTKSFPGMKGKILWTYDPAAKKFYELAVDDGGGVMRGESDGMKDGKMTWAEEGAMMGKACKLRTTIINKSKDEIEIQMERQGDGGTWTPMGKDSCKKG